MRRSGLLCTILALACGPAAARAGFDVSISATDTRQANGNYLYSYTVTDLPTSTIAITEFDIAVNDPIGVTSIKSPSDFFTFYNPGDSSLTFTTFDDGILPGSAGVFSFISSSAPGLVPELIRGLDPSTFTVVDVPGTVIGPSLAVPEPSSLLMCGLGAVGSLGLIARSRWRRAA